MKILFPILMLLAAFALSSCHTGNPQHTSSARAAYGNAVGDFKAHKKKNQKRKRKARKEAQQKNTADNQSVWHARPY